MTPADGPLEIVIDHGDLERVVSTDRPDLRMVKRLGRCVCRRWRRPGSSAWTRWRPCWLADFEIRSPLAAGVAADEARIALSHAVRRARLVASQRRALILGVAGSGKTLLAAEKARRLAAQGFEVLLTCFNRPLAEHLASHHRPPRPDHGQHLPRAGRTPGDGGRAHRSITGARRCLFRRPAERAGQGAPRVARAAIRRDRGRRGPGPRLRLVAAAPGPAPRSGDGNRLRLRRREPGPLPRPPAGRAGRRHARVAAGLPPEREPPLHAGHPCLRRTLGRSGDRCAGAAGGRPRGSPGRDLHLHRWRRRCLPQGARHRAAPDHRPGTGAPLATWSC